MSKQINHCPSCGAVWSFEENQLQQCNSCPYPELEATEDKHGYDPEFDDEIYD